jgi:hypothetical protein
LRGYYTAAARRTAFARARRTSFCWLGSARLRYAVARLTRRVLNHSHDAALTLGAPLRPRWQELAEREAAQTSAHMQTMRDRLQAALLERCSSAGVEARVNGPRDDAKRLPNTLSISLGGVQAAPLLMEVSDVLAASAGSACHAAGGAPDGPPCLSHNTCTPTSDEQAGGAVWRGVACSVHLGGATGDPPAGGVCRRHTAAVCRPAHHR